MANQNDPDMLDNYDFSGGVRGKYAKRYSEGTNLVCLDEDVAAMFSTSEEVNSALRSLGEIIRHHESIGQAKDPQTLGTGFSTPSLTFGQCLS